MGETGLKNVLNGLLKSAYHMNFLPLQLVIHTVSSDDDKNIPMLPTKTTLESFKSNCMLVCFWHPPPNLKMDNLRCSLLSLRLEPDR